MSYSNNLNQTWRVELQEIEEFWIFITW